MMLPDHDCYFSKAWMLEQIDAIVDLDARRDLVANVEGLTVKLIAVSKKERERRSSDQLALFGGEDDDSAVAEPIHWMDGLNKQCSLIDVLNAEKEHLGGYRTTHPVDLICACAILGINARDPNFVLMDRLIEIYELLTF